MNLTLPLLVLLTACVASGTVAPRAMWHFGGMIVCAQPGINPLKYNEYGCWCGFGGQGTPKDDLDRCCKVHDNCYEAASKLPGCSGVSDLPYVIEYDYTCSNQRVTCSASNNQCQKASCECDRAAAHCFASTSYNSEYKYLNPSVDCVN